MENELQPVFSHAEPVFAVSDVSETVAYWHEVLGFPNKWTWGELPNHGGVSWHGAFIQFSHNPRLAETSKGNSTWIRVQHIEALYKFHQEKNVEIVAPLEVQSYGMAQYSIREINGYYVHFAGTPLSDRKKSATTIPDTVKIIARKPTAAEAEYIASAIYGPSSTNEETKEKSLPASVFAVVAEDTATGKIIGCAFLLSDNAGFYYVRNVIVHPDWQGKSVGTSMMQELTRWLNVHAPHNAMVALHTPENLAPFYKQFDFLPSFSMIRIIDRKL